MLSRVGIIGFIAIALIPMILFSVITIHNNTATHEARITSDRISLAKAAGQAVAAYVDGNLGTVSALARAPVVADAREGGTVPPFLVQVVADNPDWDGVGIIDADGTALTGSLSTTGTVNLADRDYFQNALAGKTTVSDPIIGRIRGVVTVVLAAPVEFTNGRRGALVAPLSLDRLEGELRELNGGRGLRIIVTDAQSRVFVDSDSSLALALQPLRGSPEVDAVRAGETGTRVTKTPNGVEQLAAYAPVGAYGWGVVAYEPTALAFAPVRSALVSQLGLLGLAISIVAALIWFFGGRLADSYQATIQARLQAEEARTMAELTAHRAAFLAGLSRELAASLELDATVQTLVQLAVPEIADWCSVHTVDEAGNTRRVAAAHENPSVVETVKELDERFRLDTDGPVPQVARTGRPLLLSEIPETFLNELARSPEHLVALRGFEMRSAMIVPMIARDRAVGVLTFVATGDRPGYTEDDLAFAQDAGARAALALDNARLHQDLQRALRSRDEYFAAASHDLRNPLTAVLGAAQMLSRRLREVDLEDGDRLRHRVAIIESAANRMARLIAGLLDLARLEGGRPLDLDLAPTDLVALTRRVVAEAQHSSDLHQVLLDADGSLVGEWDSTRLERAIVNLVDNAVKYTPDGGEIRVEVRSGMRDGKPAAVLTVDDVGVGIPAADLPHVFEQFRRGSNVIGQVWGTGLGLAGARQIVEEHGGTIAIESEVGQGTTVTVVLPLESDEELEDDLEGDELNSDRSRATAP